MKVGILLLFILFLKPAYADKIYIANEKLTQEFAFLVESIQDENAELIQSKIESIQSSFKKIPLEQINFILKTEIIKFLLEDPPQKFKIKNLDPNILKNGAARRESSQNKLSPFALWLLESLHSDLTNLMSSAHFPVLAQQVRTGKIITDPKLKKLLSQLKIILPIYSYFVSTPPQEYLVYQKQLSHKVFNHLLKYFEYYLALHPQQKTLENIQYFTKKDRPSKLQQGIMAILEAARIDTQKKESNQEEEWTPKDHLVLFPTPDPNYEPPEELPKPVENWVSKMGPLRPKPNPKYVPPTNLPKPVRNWIEKIPPTPVPATDPDEEWFIQ